MSLISLLHVGKGKHVYKQARSHLYPIHFVPDAFNMEKGLLGSLEWYWYADPFLSHLQREPKAAEGLVRDFFLERGRPVDVG